MTEVSPTSDDDPEADLRTALRRLISLLKDPYHGLVTWCDECEQARNDVARELRNIMT